MDFGFSAADQAFRGDVRDFIAREWAAPPAGASPDEAHATTRAFEKKMAQHGWLTMAWPEEYGGRGASHIQQMIYREEASLAGAPMDVQGAGMVGPCLMLHGSDAQKREFLPPIANADMVWAQGYSEPGSGSDLASLQTRARPRWRRLRDQRAEDLDLRRPPSRLDPRAHPHQPRRAQASRHLLLPGRHEVAPASRCGR